MVWEERRIIPDSVGSVLERDPIPVSSRSRI